MAQKTDAALQTQNDTIQTETTANANTAARIGQMYEDIIDSKINNDKIVDEDDMVSNSATLVPSQQSVKAYVDAIGDPAWGEITGTLGNQTDLQTALGLKANLASPALTGVPTAPTAADATDNTQIATTEFVHNVIVLGTIDQASTSTAAGTITLDMNSQIQRSHVGSASFSTPKTLAMSNTTNSLFFNFIFNITSVAAVLTFPADWISSSLDFNGTTWTPPNTGKFEFGGSFDDTNNEWYIKISGPFL